MRRIAIFAIAVAAFVSGCVPEAGENEETLGKVREALPFSLMERGRVGPTLFNVSQGGNVTVTVTRLHLNPRGCSRVKGADLILIRRGPPRVELPSRNLAPDGKTKVETWNNLPAGVYELAIDPIGEPTHCAWEGDVFVVST